jgi:hypothetical protein
LFDRRNIILPHFHYNNLCIIYKAVSEAFYFLPAHISFPVLGSKLENKMARLWTSVIVELSCVISGERYDVVVNANKTPGTYWIHMRGIGECAFPENEVYQLAVLRYTGTNQARNDPPGYNGGFSTGGAVRDTKFSLSKYAE